MWKGWLLVELRHRWLWVRWIAKHSRSFYTGRKRRRSTTRSAPFASIASAATYHGSSYKRYVTCSKRKTSAKALCSSIKEKRFMGAISSLKAKSYTSANFQCRPTSSERWAISVHQRAPGSTIRAWSSQNTWASEKRFARFASSRKARSSAGKRSWGNESWTVWELSSSKQETIETSNCCRS